MYKYMGESKWELPGFFCCAVGHVDGANGRQGGRGALPVVRLEMPTLPLVCVCVQHTHKHTQRVFFFLTGVPVEIPIPLLTSARG